MQVCRIITYDLPFSNGQVVTFFLRRHTIFFPFVVGNKLSTFLLGLRFTTLSLSLAHGRAVSLECYQAKTKLCKVFQSFYVLEKNSKKSIGTAQMVYNFFKVSLRACLPRFQQCIFVSKSTDSTDFGTLNIARFARHNAIN